MLVAQRTCSAETDRVLVAEQIRLNILLMVASIALLSAVVFSLGISIYIRRAVLRTLVRMIAIMTELSGGRLGVEISVAQGKHEIARLTAATIRFQETACQAQAMAQA